MEELIYEIRENGSDGRIIYRPPSGYGVPLTETITLYIEHHAADATFSLVLTSLELAVANWAKKLFPRKREEGKTARKRTVIILGPDGKPLKRIKVDSEDEIEVTDTEDSS